jgi:hypothetical protein
MGDVFNLGFNQVYINTRPSWVFHHQDAAFRVASAMLRGQWHVACSR